MLKDLQLKYKEEQVGLAVWQQIVLWQDGLEVLWPFPLSFNIEPSYVFYEKDQFEGMGEPPLLIQKIFVKRLLYCYYNVEIPSVRLSALWE